MSFESSTKEALRAIGADVNALYARGSGKYVGTGTTAQRPSAVTAGVGAFYYDTTISAAIWSNGTVWAEPSASATLPAVDFLTDYNTALA
jgi:hypothetical protein